MDHRNIEEHQVVDRYLMGRLPPDEAAAFEQHFLDCPDCLAELEVAEKLQLGFKVAAARSATARAGVLAAVWRALRSPQGAAVFAAMLLALLLPIGWLQVRLEERGEEVGRLRQIVAEEREAASTASRELGAERQALEGVQARLSQALAPQENLLVASLGAERGSAGGAPSLELHLPASPRWIVFALELAVPEASSYRAELVGDSGEVAWSSGALEPDRLDNLNIGFHSSLLATGDYTVRVYGKAQSDSAIASYRFRVLGPS